MINKQTRNVVKLGNPVFSPDGKFLAYIYAEGLANNSLQWQLAITRLDGEQVLIMERKLDFPRDVHFDLLAWSPDSGGFDFLQEKDEVFNIVRYPIDGSPPKHITNFDSQVIFSHAWSKTRRRLAYSRGMRVSDAVMIKDVRWPSRLR